MIYFICKKIILCLFLGGGGTHHILKEAKRINFQKLALSPPTRYVVGIKPRFGNNLDYPLSLPAH